MKIENKTVGEYIKMPRVDINKIDIDTGEEKYNKPSNNHKSIMKAEWISEGEGYNWHFKCSNCGYIDGFPFNDRLKECPNCGAKMKNGVK